MNAVRALPRRLAWLVVLAALINGLAAALTAFLPDVLNGTPVMNGSARGTGFVMALLGAPALVVAAWLAARGSWRAIIAIVGLLAYVGYNDTLFLYATPFNRLFLLYCAGSATTIFTAIAVLRALDVDAIRAQLPHVPARGLAVYLWLIVAFNTVAWLGRAVPGILGAYPPDFLTGTGLVTNPIYAQDLSFWLPAAAIVGALLWQRRAWGVVLGGAWLVYGFIEAIGVATDQWLGSSADPTSTVATMAGAWLFVVLALVGIVPLFVFFRPTQVTSTRLVPGATHA